MITAEIVPWFLGMVGRPIMVSGLDWVWVHTEWSWIAFKEIDQTRHHLIDTNLETADI